MQRTRDEERLLEIRGQIDALSVVSRDDFNLRDRYSSLVKLEGILAQRVSASRGWVPRERTIGHGATAADSTV
jgi:hypothetical protein